MCYSDLFPSHDMGQSYANISGKEVGSGKPNVTPTTAKNNPGFKGNNNNQNPVL